MGKSRKDLSDKRNHEVNSGQNLDSLQDQSWWDQSWWDQSWWDQLSSEEKEDYAQTWDLFALSDHVEEHEITDQYERLKNDLGIQQKKSTKVVTLLARIAATIAGISILTWVFLNQLTTEKLRVSATNQIEDVNLPDGTVVTLDNQSTMEFSRGSLLSKSREVNLSGKAYFDVAHDKKHPFVIKTTDAVIEVLGTKFTVNSKRGFRTEVRVLEGKVQVAYIDQKPLFLTQNQKTSLLHFDNIPTIAPDSSKNRLSWIDQKLLFEKSNMKEVIKVLEETYHVRYLLKTPDFMECRISANFHRDSLSTVHQVIQATFGVEITQLDSKTFSIDGQNCHRN